MTRSTSAAKKRASEHSKEDSGKRRRTGTDQGAPEALPRARSGRQAAEQDRSTRQRGSKAPLLEASEDPERLLRQKRRQQLKESPRRAARQPAAEHQDPAEAAAAAAAAAMERRQSGGGGGQVCT
jgi:hypothetical protein